MVLMDYGFWCGHVKRELTPHKVLDLANLGKSKTLYYETVVYFAFQVRLLMEIQKKNKNRTKPKGLWNLS